MKRELLIFKIFFDKSVGSKVVKDKTNDIEMLKEKKIIVNFFLQFTREI